MLRKTALLLVIFIQSLFVLASSVKADLPVDFGGVPLKDRLNIPLKQLGGTNGAITILIQTAIIIASIGFFAYLIVGGIKWMVSGGDKAASQGARETITHALTGLIIVVGSYAIIRIIEAAFGVSIVTGGIKFPSPTP